jgi:NADH:ubiquinone oxidoreductase subunit H
MNIFLFSWIPGPVWLGLKTIFFLFFYIWDTCCIPTLPL